MSLVNAAREYARWIHAEQYRKYTGEPYFVHLAEVAELVAEVGARDEVIAAAFLHDSIEDQGQTREGLAGTFGNDVARLVWEVSDQSRPEDGNRETRKRIDREHLARASAEGMTIKLADLISNTTSIVARDPHFAVRYMREKRLLIPHLTAGNQILYRRALDLLKAYEAGRPPRAPADSPGAG